MDPDETLRQLRFHIRWLCDHLDWLNPETTQPNALVLIKDLVELVEHLDTVTKLVECAEALDLWLTRGGSLPAQWTRDPGQLPTQP